MVAFAICLSRSYNRKITEYNNSVKSYRSWGKSAQNDRLGSLPKLEKQMREQEQWNK